jgi:hypothetical protein
LSIGAIRIVSQNTAKVGADQQNPAALKGRHLQKHLQTTPLPPENPLISTKTCSNEKEGEMQSPVRHPEILHGI